MSHKRKQYSPQFKVKVALEAVRGEKTISELTSQSEGEHLKVAKIVKYQADRSGKHNGQITLGEHSLLSMGPPSASCGHQSV